MVDIEYMLLTSIVNVHIQNQRSELPSYSTLSCIDTVIPHRRAATSPGQAIPALFPVLSFSFLPSFLAFSLLSVSAALGGSSLALRSSFVQKSALHFMLPSCVHAVLRRDLSSSMCFTYNWGAVHICLRVF